MFESSVQQQKNARWIDSFLSHCSSSSMERPVKCVLHQASSRLNPCTILFIASSSSHYTPLHSIRILCRGLYYAEVYDNNMLKYINLSSLFTVDTIVHGLDGIRRSTAQNVALVTSQKKKLKSYCPSKLLPTCHTAGLSDNQLTPYNNISRVHEMRFH